MSTPSLPYIMKPSGLLSIFILLVKNGLDKGACIISSGNSSDLYATQCKTSLYSKTLRLKLLEMWDLCACIPFELQICWLLMYTSTLEKSECKLLFTWVTRRIRASCFLCRCRFFVCFCPFFVFFFTFFVIASFVITTLYKFQFQSQLRLSQINIVIPLFLKVKLYAFCAEWDSKKKLLFMGRQEIAIYWDFPSKISGNCHKKLVPKNARHE